MLSSGTVLALCCIASMADTAIASQVHQQSPPSISFPPPSLSVSVSPWDDVRPRPLFGFGNEFIFQTNSDKRLNAALRQAGSELSRFPGGTPSDYWLWSEGWINQTSDRSGSANLPLRPTNVTELHQYLQNATIKQASVLVLNQLQTNITYQLQGLHAHQDAGTRIQFVELGNEMYDATRPDVLAAYPQPKDYAERMASWTAAIKTAFPTSQVALVGVANYWDNRTQLWNQQVLQNPISQQADAATIHLYAGLPSEPLTPDTFPKILALAAKNVDGYQGYTDSTIPNRFRLWVTEWGTFGNTDIFNTWLQGLVHVAFTLLLPRIPRIDIILPYCAVCGDPAMPSFTSQYGPIEPVNATDALWNRTASGHTYAVLFNAVQNMSYVSSASFSPNPNLDPDVDNSHQLEGLYFFHDSGRSSAFSLVFTNLGSITVSVKLNGALQCSSSNAVADVYYPNTQADITRKNILVDDLGHLHLENPSLLIAPPYSMAVYTCA